MNKFVWIMLLVSFNAMAQYKPFQPNPQNLFRDPDFMAIAQAVDFYGCESPEVLGTYFMHIDSMAVFEGVWKHESTVFIVHDYLHYSDEEDMVGHYPLEVFYDLCTEQSCLHINEAGQDIVNSRVSRRLNSQRCGISVKDTSKMICFYLDRSGFEQSLVMYRRYHS